MPLPVVVDDKVLDAVDELGQGNVRVVAECVDGLEALSAVLELEAEEVTAVGGCTAAELNDKGGSVVG